MLSGVELFTSSRLNSPTVGRGVSNTRLELVSSVAVETVHPCKRVFVLSPSIRTGSSVYRSLFIIETGYYTVLLFLLS